MEAIPTGYLELPEKIENADKNIVNRKIGKIGQQRCNFKIKSYNQYLTRSMGKSPYLRYRRGHQILNSLLQLSHRM